MVGVPGVARAADGERAANLGVEMIAGKVDHLVEMRAVRHRSDRSVCSLMNSL